MPEPRSELLEVVQAMAAPSRILESAEDTLEQLERVLAASRAASVTITSGTATSSTVAEVAAKVQAALDTVTKVATELANLTYYIDTGSRQLQACITGQAVKNAEAGKRGATCHPTPRRIVRPAASKPAQVGCRRRHRLTAGPPPQHARGIPQSDDPSPSMRPVALVGPVAWATLPGGTHLST